MNKIKNSFETNSIEQWEREKEKKKEKKEVSKRKRMDKMKLTDNDYDRKKDENECSEQMRLWGRHTLPLSLHLVWESLPTILDSYLFPLLSSFQFLSILIERAQRLSNSPISLFLSCSFSMILILTVTTTQHITHTTSYHSHLLHLDCHTSHHLCYLITSNDLIWSNALFHSTLSWYLLLLSPLSCYRMSYYFLYCYVSLCPPHLISNTFSHSPHHLHLVSTFQS